MTGSERELARTISLPSHHKQPAWRWVTILDYVINWKKPLRRVLVDEYLYVGTKFARHLKNLDRNCGAIRSAFPPIEEAYRYFTRSDAYSYRWILEALILSGLDDEEISEHLEMEFGSDTVKAYKKLFFDVEDYLENNLLLEANLFSACMSSATDFNDYDFAWKLVAHARGSDAALAVMSPAGTNSDDVSDWIKDKIRSKLLTKSLQVVANTRLLYRQEIMTVFEYATRSWDGPEGSQRKQAEKVFLEDMASSMIGSVSMTLLCSPKKVLLQMRLSRR
jgi:hypothetical protein